MADKGPVTCQQEIDSEPSESIGIRWDVAIRCHKPAVARWRRPRTPALLDQDLPLCNEHDLELQNRAGAMAAEGWWREAL